MITIHVPLEADSQSKMNALLMDLGLRINYPRI